jgi:hypothetical protein
VSFPKTFLENIFVKPKQVGSSYAYNVIFSLNCMYVKWVPQKNDGSKKNIFSPLSWPPQNYLVTVAFMRLSLVGCTSV